MRLLAIDMDGTCLNHKQQITDRTRNALRKASAAGIEIVPTTGRTSTCLPAALKEESCIHYCITSNGARVINLQTGETLFHAPIPKEDALAILKGCKGGKLGVTAHIDDQYYVQGRWLYLLGRMQYGKDAANAFCVRDIEGQIAGQATDFDELQFFYFSVGARQEARMLLSDHCIQAVYASQYVEVFSKEANKGSALTALAKRLAVPKQQVACIGDGENDVFMFDAAGTKFAMGNAVPSLKERADHVVASNRDDGVAQAIETYLLS